MSDSTLALIFSAIGVWNGALTMALLGLIIAHVRMKVAVDLFIDSLGKGLAKALHQDDDHLGLDALIDEYKKHGYDLPNELWKAMKLQCDTVINNPTATKLEKLQAVMLSAVADHKMMRKF